MKLLLSSLLVLAAAGPAVTAGPNDSTPAINWGMTLFTRENFHSMTLRGSRATFPSNQEIDVVDLNLTVFTSDATNRVESIILSKAATFLPKENLARGENGVRLIRDDLEAIGDRWTYDHAKKKVSLRGSVRVVFNAELKSILK